MERVKVVDPLAKRRIGRTDVEVTQLGFGGGTLGDLRERITEAQAEATIRTAWDGGVRFYDTAPFYGNTKSEHRVGHALRNLPRDEFVLSTKVGRVYYKPKSPEQYEPYGWHAGLPFNFRCDYSRDGVMRSYEDSLQRLGMTRVDALLIHDLDFMFHKTEEGVKAHLDALDTGGGHAALHELKASGEIRAIGAGINELGMIPRFLERFDLDFFIIAMPYTLLSQEALDKEMADCLARGVGVVIGAPFAGVWHVCL
jgi:D-threo-aldose 1-dehydrogenase